MALPAHDTVLPRASWRERRSRSRAGFTMLEMVIVMAILAMVMITLLMFVVRTANDLKEANLLVKEGREGPAILAQIERDLASAYADPRMKKIFEAKKDGEELRFVTSRDSTLFLNGVQSDLTEVGYRLKRNSIESSQQLYTLYRREDYSMDDEPLEGGKWIPLATNVVSLQFLFYSLPKDQSGQGIDVSALQLGQGDSEELNDWKSEDRYLPYAVKIILRVDLREGEQMRDVRAQLDGTQTFLSIVRLPPFPRNLPQTEDKADLKLNLPTPPASNPGGGTGGASGAGGAGGAAGGGTGGAGGTGGTGGTGGN